MSFYNFHQEIQIHTVQQKVRQLSFAIKSCINSATMELKSFTTYTELGTRYFKSNDIGTDTLLKKYRRYR